MSALSDRPMNFPEEMNRLNRIFFSCSTEENLYFSSGRRSSVEKLEKSKNPEI